jgi:holo-[acyl-carrier protein] synthase
MRQGCEKVIGVGLDVVEISRIESAINRRPRIVDRLFSEEEKAFCSGLADPWENWAVRFAAKEAVMKSVGASPAAMPWKMISVVRSRGRPQIQLYGRARQYAHSIGCDRFEISLTHEAGLAVAIALALSYVRDI